MTNWHEEFEKQRMAERSETIYWTLALVVFGIVADTVMRMWWQP